MTFEARRRSGEDGGGRRQREAEIDAELASIAEDKKKLATITMDEVFEKEPELKKRGGRADQERPVVLSLLIETSIAIETETRCKLISHGFQSASLSPALASPVNSAFP